ncbi:MAG: tRNA (N6-threonylcarbamoyladenosine(37)-N6)-methyltransferase TrmO, partial [Oceanobacter sp.]
GTIELLPPFNREEALDGLTGVSHVWLIFLFHQSLTNPDSVRLKVRPPRLGGNQQLGVFATRSNFRPNGIGQSLVKLDSIEGTRLKVSGVDLLDQTPILDIKPYVPYADAIPAAINEIAPAPPELMQVDWSENAERAAQEVEAKSGNPVTGLINECLAQDPRPAYQAHDPERIYGTQLWQVNVRWKYPTPEKILVLSVEWLD